MNHVYRVIWNGSAACWQAVSETARGKSKSRKSSTASTKAGLKQLAIVSGVAASLLTSHVAMARPLGAVFVSGSVGVNVTGNDTLIKQFSNKAILNWSEFSIANGEKVDVEQPDANSVLLNRVITATPSVISGTLNANGQVFIVNPNGITFGSTAQVNVGGLVASTLDISDTDFNNGTYRFASSSNNASITNQGSITVANTGTAALIAPSIQQAGSIINNDGTILLTAASDVTLSLNNRVLNSQTINAGHNTATINNSAGLLQADGGKVLLNAQGINSASTASISSAGTIRAQTLAGNDRGAIDLIADYTSGTVNLTGTLDASAPTNGFGGTIRTFGADVAVSNSASVTTRKVSQTSLPGSSSVWQIRANSINVGSGGTISGSKLSSSLNDGSVSLTAVGAGTGQGNTSINDAVSSSGNVILSLSAAKDIHFNNNVSLTGAQSRLILNYNNTNDYYLNNGSKITLSGANASLRINNTDYTVVNSLGVEGDTSSTTLQGIKNNLTGNYALGSDIDASATSGWNGGRGFDPIGSYGTSYLFYINPNATAPNNVWITQTDVNNPFSGQFHGLGHTVNNLYINRPDTYPATIPEVLPATVNVGSVGLFAASSNLLRNIGLNNSAITGINNVGTLVGVQTQGLIKNSFSTGSVNGNQSVGGLIGLQQAGTASYSTSSATVSGTSQVGGLIGTSGVRGVNPGLIISTGLISNASSTGTVNGSSLLGGLVGLSYSNIQDSYSTVNFNFANNFNASFVGGLVGRLESASVSNSHASGNLSGSSLYAAGGLIGNMSWSASVNQSHSTGDVNGFNDIGGLVGQSQSSSIANSYASGDVTGTDTVGGLVGIAKVFTLVSSSASGSVQGNNYAGGLLGYSEGPLLINLSHNSGNVSGLTNIGGLVGKITGTSSSSALISQSHNTGIISGSYSVGGLAGSAASTITGNISFDRSYNTGSVTAVNNVGGLVGDLYAQNQLPISNSYNSGSVYGADAVGGLIGRLEFGFFTPVVNPTMIANSYTTGLVSGSTATGAMIGKDASGIEQTNIVNSFWDTSSSGQTTAVGGWAPGAGTTGKTTAELKQIATFTGWDIADVSNTSSNSTWLIDENNATPWLR